MSWSNWIPVEADRYSIGVGIFLPGRIGWPDAIRKEIGDPRPRIEQADLDRDIAAIKAKIGDDAYETAYHAGQSLTLDKAVAIVLAGKNQHSC